MSEKRNIFSGTQDRFEDTVKSNIPEVLTVWLMFSALLLGISDIPVNALSILLCIVFGGVLAIVLAFLISVRNHMVSQLTKEKQKREKENGQE